MPDRSTIIKYLKVKALADRGDIGERDNAQRILEKMEADSPTLRRAADEFLRQASGVPDPVQAPPGWENIFNLMRAAAGTVFNFAETISQAYYGKIVASYVESSLRETRAGNIIIGLKMSAEVYEQAIGLNTIQRQAFRQALHQMLGAELDVLLGENEQEDEYAEAER